MLTYVALLTPSLNLSWWQPFCNDFENIKTSNFYYFLDEGCLEKTRNFVSQSSLLKMRLNFSPDSFDFSVVMAQFLGWW